MPPTECSKCFKNDPRLRCSRCRSAWYCSLECQKEDWATHKPGCIPQSITGIIIHCESQRRHTGPFQTINIDPSHEIHRSGMECPVSKMVRVPLVIYRHTPVARWPDPAQDNQIATYLMIAPTTGFAPQDWQQAVGTVTVMRKDGKPLTPQAIETIWMFHDHLLDVFSDDPDRARGLMNRAKFDQYCRSYKSEVLGYPRKEFEEMVLPL